MKKYIYIILGILLGLGLTVSASIFQIQSGSFKIQSGTMSIGDYTNLSASNVRYGIAFGIGSTGTMSPYINTPSGISGLDQTVCTNAKYTWTADSNYDGVSDDPICATSTRITGAYDWNMSGVAPYNVLDNTYIGDYGCSGDTNGDGTGTLSTDLSGTVVNGNWGNDASSSLAIADCKDGIRNLLTQAYVVSFNYSTPTSTGNTYNGPLNPQALVAWKGTRLPTSNDFFGICGNNTTSTIYGSYGGQIGRTDNVIPSSIGTWEWLSEQYYYTDARIAGTYACSSFGINYVTTPYRFRVVFRP